MKIFHKRDITCCRTPFAPLSHCHAQFDPLSPSGVTYFLNGPLYCLRHNCTYEKLYSSSVNIVDVVQKVVWQRNCDSDIYSSWCLLILTLSPPFISTLLWCILCFILSVFIIYVLVLRNTSTASDSDDYWLARCKFWATPIVSRGVCLCVGNFDAKYLGN